MKKSLIGIFSGIIFIAAAALTAQAQMCGGCMGEKGGGMQEGGTMECMGHQGMGMMRGMGCGMMMDDDHPMWKHLMGLGLDDKQMAALKALRSKTMKDMVKKRADLELAGIELKDLLDKDPMDLKAVEALLKKKESLKTEMFLAHIRAHEEMKSLLTPDQRKRLKEMMEGHGAGCGMMGNMMHGDAEHKDMPMHQHTP
jgi:Spy/CpxP family protein refolding chaperone